jgi:hypothetical protein
MASQLNIKDPATNALVAELAALTRTSKTEAVRAAGEGALAREKTRHREEVERMLRELEPLQARVRELRRPEDFLTDGDIYDENGHPK